MKIIDWKKTEYTGCLTTFCPRNDSVTGSVYQVYQQKKVLFQIDFIHYQGVIGNGNYTPLPSNRPQHIFVTEQFDMCP